MKCGCNFRHVWGAGFRGCGAALLLLTAASHASLAGTSDVWDTRISIQDECPITGREQIPTERALVPILASAGLSLFQALLPKAIDVGLTFAASEARKSAQADNSINEVAGLGWVDGFYQLSKSEGGDALAVTSHLANKCLVVARGLYASSDVAASFSGKPWTEKAVEERLKKLGLKRDPGIYLEARFRVSPDGSHFRIEPIRFYFDRALHDGTQPSQEFDLAFEFKFQTPSGESRGASFALGNLVLRGVVKGENLKEEALAVSSTGWMPILPQTAEIATVSARVTGLYAMRERLTQEITEAEADIKRLADAWGGQDGQPADGGRHKLFEKVGEEAETELSKEEFDDSYFEALLKAQAPAGAAEGASGDEEKASRELERVKRVIERNRTRTALHARKERSRWGIDRLSLLDLKRKELAEVEAQIAALERDEPIFAPVNIIVSIKEQISKPENKFLMTAADILEGSKDGVKSALIANLTPEGRAQQRKEEADRLADEGALVLTAMEARRLAQEREIALKSLPAGATEIETLNARSALDAARVQANIAALRAGLTPPYRDAFGGSQ